MDTSWGRCEAPERRPGGLLGRPGRVFFSFGSELLFLIGFKRISSPVGPYFFTAFEATTRPHQRRIWTQRKAKASIAASPGILGKTPVVFVDLYTLTLHGL